MTLLDCSARERAALVVARGRRARAFLYFRPAGTFRCPEAELGPLQGAGVRCAVLTCGQLVCTSVFTAGGTHRPACPWSLRTTTELVATTYIYPIERPSVKTRALCFQTASRSAHALLWDFHHK